MRGKAEVRHERDQEPGITPACAGKRHCPRFRPGKTRDHPRVCGEKSSLMQMDVGPLGSPPRMRGKGELPKDTKDYFGITPAYAGKRMLYARAVRRDRDHPRVCGEKTAPRHRLHLAKGSPPRMRGKEWFRDENLQQPGITPAYAGKSALMPAVMAGSQDHPRVCGEKRLVKRRARCLGGSPPRMRGKDLCDVICGQQSGITPAYAGKRYPYQYAEYCIGDHPRVCGEKPLRPERKPKA